MRTLQGWYLPDTDTDFERWLLNGTYQKHQRDTILRFVKSNKGTLRNAIDVGAHIGFWLRDMCNEFKHVYAFEPMDEVRECLFENIKAKNYTCFTNGLGNEMAVKKVKYNPEATGNTYISEDGNKEISIKKLDTFYLPDIDYIKIDAEGYEIEVLKGGTKLIEMYKPFIHVEIKDKVLVKQGLTNKDVSDYLESINYKPLLNVSSEHVYGPK